LPIYNWFRITEDKDYTYLCKYITFSEPYLRLHFEKVYAQYIDFVGISAEYKSYLNKVIELELLEIDYALTNDRYYLTFIKLKQNELDALKKEDEKPQFSMVNAYVSKFMGFSIDQKKVTVKEYFEFVKLMKEQNGK
jgi:hypothetical protein